MFLFPNLALLLVFKCKHCMLGFEEASKQKFRSLAGVTVRQPFPSFISQRNQQQTLFILRFVVVVIVVFTVTLSFCMLGL